MLNVLQKEELLKVALTTFRMQLGKEFDYRDFNVVIDKPNYYSICSFILTTQRADDNFRIKLYLKDFSNFISVGNYQLLQFKDYTTGPLDEVYVADCTLDKTVFASFMRYVASPEFAAEMSSSDRIALENGTGFISLENGSGNLVLEV